MQTIIDEEHIIQQLIADDNSIINGLYHKYKKGCLYSLQKLGADSVAEDIFQEAFLSFVVNVKRGKFRGESKLSTYINTIAKYKFFNHSKKRKPWTEDISELEIVVDENDDTTYDSERIEELTSKLEALDEKCKTLLRSFYFKGTDLKNLSTEMGISYDFIRQKKSRCIKKLKNSMTK